MLVQDRYPDHEETGRTYGTALTSVIKVKSIPFASSVYILTFFCCIRPGKVILYPYRLESNKKGYIPIGGKHNEKQENGVTFNYSMPIYGITCRMRRQEDRHK